MHSYVLAGESVFARCLSSLKSERVEASKILKGPAVKFEGDKKQFIEDIRKVPMCTHMRTYTCIFTSPCW